MTPTAWRNSLNLSVAQAAALVGIVGKNPARTWKRWEIGERTPSIEKVARIEALSMGKLTADSWAAARAIFRDRINAPSSPSAGNTADRIPGSSAGPIPDSEASLQSECAPALDADQVAVDRTSSSSDPSPTASSDAETVS